jgi:hypothetical protein
LYRSQHIFFTDIRFRFLPAPTHCLKSIEFTDS